jgi:hypothetical protein
MTNVASTIADEMCARLIDAIVLIVLLLLLMLIRTTMPHNPDATRSWIPLALHITQCSLCGSGDWPPLQLMRCNEMNGKNEMM